jgi:hypothetical protein
VTWIKCGLALGALVALGVFITVISADTSIEAYNEPGTPGKFGIQFSLGVAIVLGWALLSAVEAAWKVEDKADDDYSDWWGPFVLAALPRLIGGIVVFFVVVVIGLGFEALGLGLGTPLPAPLGVATTARRLTRSRPGPPLAERPGAVGATVAGRRDDSGDEPWPRWAPDWGVHRIGNDRAARATPPPPVRLAAWSAALRGGCRGKVW